MSPGIALGLQDSVTRDAGRGLGMGADTELSGLFEPGTDQVACANMGFGPVILASVTLWGLIGFAINWALHV